MQITIKKFILKNCTGNSKLRRMKSAIDANMVTLPLSCEYQEVHLIASLLKSYLRSLPEPLLTFKYYDQFIKACQMASEADRKSAILSIINELKETREDYYTNLRYLMRFLSKLSENHQVNKMSTQNIAIVMSPNLLWSEDDSDEGNYAMQVNSTAFGNTIVEMLVADWHYFFGEDNVDFFVTLTKDKLLSGYGDSLHEPLSESRMTKSFNENRPHPSHASHQSNTNSESPAKNHSRAGSHDTSQILMDPMKKSQSNSSLSDHSSPTHGSPRPNTRIKKKITAPPPPPAAFSSKADDLQFIDCDAEDLKSGKIKAAKSTENLIKSERPARPPAINAQCQTIGRSGPRYTADGEVKRIPIPAVRTSVPLKSISKSDDEDVVIRPRIQEKPVIPERPTIVRPASFRASATSPTSKGNSIESHFIVKPLLNKNNSCPSEDSHELRNSGNGNGTSLIEKKVPTVLERTQVYNIDKVQQVAIVDVNVNNSNSTPSAPPLPPGFVPRKDGPLDNQENKENSHNASFKFLSNEIQDNNSLMTTSTSSTSSDHQVPHSPRALDNKALKRPQVPPPATPLVRPKSSDGDNTKL